MVLRFYEDKMTQLYLPMCFYGDEMVCKSGVVAFGSEESYFFPFACEKQMTYWLSIEFPP